MIQFKAKTNSGGIINSALSPFTFPAGEKHIKREERRSLERTEIAVIQPSATSLHDDLFQLMLWNDYVLHTNPSVRRVLVLPYAPAARADRGMPHGAAVYASAIANLLLDEIILFDPHSDDWVNQFILADEAALTDVSVVYPFELLSSGSAQPLFAGRRYTGIIAPDKGAADRAGSVADVWGLPLVQAEKTRDFETGQLTGFSVDVDPEGTYLVVDDICDGGGTFKGLAKASGLSRSQLDLYVSHGVFSGKAAELAEYFDTVYTTNSYKSSNTELPHVTLAVTPLLLNRIITK